MTNNTQGEEELNNGFEPFIVDGQFMPPMQPEMYDEPGAELGRWTMPDEPTEPCPCCGADIPQDPVDGYVCSVCMWEIDYDVQGQPDAPSKQNRGLSLNEAQMNFRAFGICDPWIDKEE